MKIVLIESLSVPDKVISDFGDELVMRYKEMGINVSKEKATSTYITVKSN